MDRSPIIQEQKLFKPRLDFPIDKMIENVDRQAVIQAPKQVETQVSFLGNR